MNMVIARLLLRYAAGALVAAGFLSPDLGDQLGVDQDLIILVGAGLSAIAEGAYLLAKKKGWTT